MTPETAVNKPLASPASDQHRWFAEEVHAHGAVLKAYLRGAFPGLHDIDDLVQESYLRVWRTSRDRPIRSVKAFLFQVARHLAIDRIRHERCVPQEGLGDLAGLAVFEEKPDAADELDYREKVSLVAQALASLPARCREIMILRKFQHLPQREVAVRLGISERTVENHLARGMKLCARYLRQRGVRGFSSHEE